MIATGLYACAAVTGLFSVAAVNTQQLLSGEEVSVSFLDVVGVSGRFQSSRYATNFAGHVQFWLFSHLDPAVDLFYGRTCKALAMALLAPLVYGTLRRGLGCRPAAAALGALGAVLTPGVDAFAWLATENGLEALWGMAALLLSTSRRRGWVLAPLLAGVAVSTYGSGLAWAGAVLAVVVVRLVRSRRRWRELGPVAAATVAGAGVVAFPLIWWRGGGRILVGGGSADTAMPGTALGSLWRELAERGDSYYYFTSAPALGSLWLAVVLLAAVVVGTALRPALWPWTATLVLTVALYAASGGVLGVRRAIAIPVVALMGLAVVLDRLVHSRSRRTRVVAVAVVAALTVIPLGAQYLDDRSGLASGRYRIHHDFRVPLPAGRTMPEEVALLTEQLNSGALTYRQLAMQREGERSLAMIWLLAERHHADLTGLATPADIARLVQEGPRCQHDCRPVPGRV